MPVTGRARRRRTRSGWPSSSVWWARLGAVSRDLISDEVWAVLGRCSQRRGRRAAHRWTGARSSRRRPGGSVPRAGRKLEHHLQELRPLVEGRVCTRVLEQSSRWRTRTAASSGSRRSTQRSCASISTARPCPGTQGAGSNYKRFGDEPPDQAIGRSRGGLTTKTHLVADGKGRAFAFVLTAGQVATRRCWPRRSRRSGSGDPRAARVCARTGCWRTRATRPGRTAPGCASTESAPQPPSATTRSRTAASGPAGPLTSATLSGSATRAATSSSAASTSSNSGAGSRCAQTRPPATATLANASPPRSTGSPAALATRPRSTPQPGSHWLQSSNPCTETRLLPPADEHDYPGYAIPASSKVESFVDDVTVRLENAGQQGEGRGATADSADRLILPNGGTTIRPMLELVSLLDELSPEHDETAGNG